MKREGGLSFLFVYFEGLEVREEEDGCTIQSICYSTSQFDFRKETGTFIPSLLFT